MQRNDHYHFNTSSSIDQRSYQQYAHQPISDPLEDVLGIFPCVKLRGLPFEATVGDILIFFNGITVLDVIFFVKEGKTTGEAVVLFSSMPHYEAGLQRNHQHMGRRYVEVFQAKRADYYLAASLRIKSEQMTSGPNSGSYISPSSSGQFRPQGRAAPTAIPTEHTGVIRMRGLPFNVTIEDILQFFRAYGLQHEAVKIAFRYDGRPTGEAFVNFDSSEIAAQALSLDRGEIGSRYIELFISTPEAFTRALTY